MIADTLTKPLPQPQFEILVEEMGVYSYDMSGAVGKGDCWDMVPP